MLRLSLEQIAIVIPMILLLADATYGRPRRRFCENYPFAPKCMGVSAKRSPSQYEEKNRQSTIDIYSNLIKRVLDEAKQRPPPESKEPILMQDKHEMYDDDTLLVRIASLVDNVERGTYKQDRFMDSPNTWPDNFNDEDRGI